MTERKWFRYGHSCELLGEDTMVVMGGDGPGPNENYFWNIDILNLVSLSWSKVKIKSKKIRQVTRFVGFRV